MADLRKYHRPPIVEAIIELRVGEPISIKERQSAASALAKLYPKSETLKELGVHIDTTASNMNVKIEQGEQGFKLTNEDQTDVVMLLPTGVATARLAPYLGWEHLRAQAEVVGEAWKRKTGFRRFVRVGARYINRLDIPANPEGAIDLEEYLRFHPKMPDMAPASVKAFLVQVTIESSTPKWLVNLTSAPTESPLIGHHSILLDIDVFRTEELPNKLDDLWPIVDEARTVKNQVFESCLTERTRELFGK